MPQYAVIGRHQPNECPMTNKAVREFFKKTYHQLPKIAKEFNVEILSLLHLDPNHKGFFLFEAPNAETVRDFLVQAGFLHYLDVDFHLVTPIDALAKHIDDFPTLY